LYTARSVKTQDSAFCNAYSTIDTTIDNNDLAKFDCSWILLYKSYQQELIILEAGRVSNTQYTLYNLLRKLMPLLMWKVLNTTKSKLFTLDTTLLVRKNCWIWWSFYSTGWGFDTVLVAVLLIKYISVRYSCYQFPTASLILEYSSQLSFRPSE